MQAVKKNLILIFVLSQAMIINAQTYHPFPESNAIWHEYFQGNSYHYAYQNILRNSDTIINNLTFHRLYRHGYSPDTSCIGALAEDSSRRIFFFDIDSKYVFLLYDFSLDVGDTMFYPDTACGNYCYSFNYEVVTGIDYIFDGVDSRRRFQMSGDYWFEGIGSIQGLLHPITPLLTCYCDWDLVYFSHGDTVEYWPYDIDNIHETDRSDEIKIYPNPSSEYVVFDFSGIDNAPFEIINSLGKIAYKGYISGVKVTLNTRNFFPGIYYLKIHLEEKTIVRKIIFI